MGNLRSLVSELLFKLSQLQHFTDTVQREKNALQQSALENERLHKTAMDGFVEDIQQLRRDNFSLAEQRVKCEGRGGRGGRKSWSGQSGMGKMYGDAVWMGRIMSPCSVLPVF